MRGILLHVSSHKGKGAFCPAWQKDFCCKNSSSFDTGGQNHGAEFVVFTVLHTILVLVIHFRENITNSVLGRDAVG